jgi:cobalt-zinc-cadmium efflux system membrane fusion protein
VTRGQPLYTIESPDLLQSESALVAAAGVYALTTKVLERDRKLHETKGISDKDLDQATSDQMSADAALKARALPSMCLASRTPRSTGWSPTAGSTLC